MFQKFKINSIVAHYITSSPTSQAGDILFYYERDRFSPMVDYSNSSFLPYVLSDPHTMIGPQWTNHSMLVKPTADWKTTMFGNQTDLNEDAAGSLFLFSKTNAANSPGYLLIDYDISFKELSVNPRSGTLPIARAQSSFVCLTAPTTFTSTSGATFTLTSGKTIANTTSVPPTGYLPGDVYKVIFQITASTQVNAAWSGTGSPTVANLLTYPDSTAITLDDGFTAYAVSLDGTNFYVFPTLEAAVANQEAGTAQSLEWGVTVTAAGVVNICAEMQLVRNIDSYTQSAY